MVENIMIFKYVWIGGFLVADISIFITNTYRVLSYMYDKKDKNNVVSITQNEIAQALELNKSTVNMFMKTLKEKGYVVQDEEHLGRYYLTESAVKTVSLFKKTEK